MKIPNKPEFQKIEISHSSDIYYFDFMNLYKNMYRKTTLFLVNNTTLKSDKVWKTKHNNRRISWKTNKCFTKFKHGSTVKISEWFFFKSFSTAEAKHELEKIKKINQEINRDYLIYKNKKKSKTYNFQKFKAIRSFGRDIYSDFITLNDAFEEQINLKNVTDYFNENTKPKKLNKKEEKVLTCENGDKCHNVKKS